MKAHLPLSKINADHAFNCRGKVHPEDVEELAEQIRMHGLLNPLIVRMVGNEYHLVAGFRRYTALQMLGADGCDVVVMQLDNRAAQMVNLSENLGRKNLNPVQEADAIVRIYGGKPSPKRAARELGRTLSWVKSRLQIKRLPPTIQAEVAEGILTLHDVTLLVKCKGSEVFDLAAKMRDRHASGEGTKQMIKNANKPRERSEIQQMISRLMDCKKQPPPWRCLAWAAKTITTEELLKDTEPDAIQ